MYLTKLELEIIALFFIITHAPKLERELNIIYIYLLKLKVDNINILLVWVFFFKKSALIKFGAKFGQACATAARSLRMNSYLIVYRHHFCISFRFQK